jgi:hypothetical protein
MHSFSEAVLIKKVKFLITFMGSATITKVIPWNRRMVTVKGKANFGIEFYREALNFCKTAKTGRFFNFIHNR